MEKGHKRLLNRAAHRQSMLAPRDTKDGYEMNRKMLWAALVAEAYRLGKDGDWLERLPPDEVRAIWTLYFEGQHLAKPDDIV